MIQPSKDSGSFRILHQDFTLMTLFDDTIANGMSLNFTRMILTILDEH